MRPEVERIEQPIPYVDEGDYYDDRDEVEARSFMAPLLFILLGVFLIAVVVALVRS
ncbi:MAG: hypothetical protein SFX73_06045 [Kofleriaceae bacterium]|nr:hypothetical protein [Kofleriaceae bacterium]